MKIGIVNDQPMAVEAIRRALAGASRHTTAWVARDGAEAVKLCAKENPDLVLMDLIMPVMDGVEATRQIMRSTPCPILVVTASVTSNTSRVFDAMGAGALDAVNTPIAEAEGAAALLAKIEIIGRLVGSRRRQPTTPKQESATSFFGRRNRLVAIGASAGGPSALAALLSKLPRDFPSAIVIIQHVDEQFAAGMAEWLGGQTDLPVRVARQNDELIVGTVLIAATKDHLALRGNEVLNYVAEPVDYPYRPSVDVFFESVAQHWRGDAAGVLLTGMGRDGSIGLKALRNRGHYTIAQDQATSAVFGMPKAAAALGAAVDILPLQRIALALIEMFKVKSQPQNL